MGLVKEDRKDFEAKIHKDFSRLFSDIKDILKKADDRMNRRLMLYNEREVKRERSIKGKVEVIELTTENTEKNILSAQRSMAGHLNRGLKEGVREIKTTILVGFFVYFLATMGLMIYLLGGCNG